MLHAPTIDASIATLIRLAIDEDLGSARGAGREHEGVKGDQTVQLSIPAELRAKARVVARKAGVIAGTFLIQPIIQGYAARGDPERIDIRAADGTRAAAGQTIAELAGQARVLLSAERVILNFLSHLSGIATLTRQFVDAVAPVQPPPAICDTRKTTPAYRILDKYAVRCGGGVNHRMGLYDGVMLKDNHLAALRERLGGGLTLRQLVANVRAGLEPGITLWLEVDTLEQLKEALGGAAHGQGPAGEGQGADIILLDNFDLEAMRRGVQMRDERESGRAARTLLEASGGITLENVLAVARTGVDRISIGALTHSAPILDLSMELVGQDMPEKS